MKRYLMFAALSLFTLAFPAAVYCQPPNPPLDVTADQSVGVLSEDPGYGERWSTTIFPFGNYTGTVSGNPVFCRTYLRFPLDGIPAGSTIQAATLHVYVDDYWPMPGSAPMSVYPVAADWTPEGVDWYDTGAWPALGSAAATTVVSSDGGWFTWDVTALVQGWRNGTPNYGLAVAASDLNSAASNWAAARRLSANEPATQPRLFVSYIAPTATPAPPQPTAAPQPTIAVLPSTPTPIPVLLPETGGRAPTLMFGLALMVGSMLCLLVSRHFSGRE